MIICCSICALCSCRQMPVSLSPIQTQQAGTLICLTIAERWRQCKRSSRIPISQRDLIAVNCWADLFWQVAVIGKLSGVAALALVSLTEESEEEETVLSVCLEGIHSPGVLSALMVVTLSGTTTEKQRSLSRPLPTEWQCRWTVLLALGPFTESPLTHGSSSTPSTPHSLNRSVLGFCFTGFYSSSVLWIVTSSLHGKMREETFCPSWTVRYTLTKIKAAVQLSSLTQAQAGGHHNLKPGWGEGKGTEANQGNGQRRQEQPSLNRGGGLQHLLIIHLLFSTEFPP